MRPFLLSTLTASAMALGACYINVDKYADLGMLGDDCVVDEDCHASLMCGPDDTCIAEPDDPGQGAGGQGASGQGGDVGGGSSGCQDDADCTQGEICLADGSCEMPLCSELNDEAGCVERSDCEAVYAGIDCSCGPDCTCTAGEAGCVCESFEFFKCQEVAN